MEQYSTLYITLTILATLLLTGCYDAPEFDEVPYIEYRKVSYHEAIQQGSGGLQLDSLSLTFYVEDGDGDIGLKEGEPYNYSIIVDAAGDTVTFQSASVKLPFYKLVPITKSAWETLEFSTVDNRPAFDCEFYEILKVAEDDHDTVYVERNIFRNNIYVDFLVKNGADNYQLKEFPTASGCAGNFHGKIPIFDESILGSPLSGEVTYHLKSLGFSIFGRDTLKLSFFIYDRAMNKSNVAETSDFTFPGLLERN